MLARSIGEGLQLLRDLLELLSAKALSLSLTCSRVERVCTSRCVPPAAVCSLTDLDTPRALRRQLLLGPGEVRPRPTRAVDACVSALAPLQFSVNWPLPAGDTRAAHSSAAALASRRGVLADKSGLGRPGCCAPRSRLLDLLHDIVHAQQVLLDLLQLPLRLFLPLPCTC